MQQVARQQTRRTEITKADTRNAPDRALSASELALIMQTQTVTFIVWNQSFFTNTYTFVDEANNNHWAHTFAPQDQPGFESPLTLAVKPGASHGWMHYWNDQAPASVTQVGWVSNGDRISLY